MKRIVALLGLMTLLTVSRTQAQSMGSEYRTAIGAKFWPGGLTVKHFIRDNRALEGIAYFWGHGFRFTGLYEVHGDINGAPGLKWYVGPGAHFGVYNERWHRNGEYYDDGDASLGVDGVLGLDYKINGAPIALSLDINPYVEFLNGAYVGVWGGLGIKFTF
ncbi:hypothetical protein FAM09_17405 [Niastella caeni]|uniref:DUF3575 domain-containing protein n=1 Tax=Niastella caeni TaxID=2569763 RepID=A0A4S8HWK9_9BACT|nr:hypothetical protein [Niastella caeni]THU38444.1 hypothetical protein FAM09_17405 [Niastella caeni]